LTRLERLVFASKMVAEIMAALILLVYLNQLWPRFQVWKLGWRGSG
jgi:hypothetical protein